MSRPCEARLAKVKRMASVPKAGMPFGKCLRVCFSILSACLGFIRFCVRLATKSSSEMPSMRSSGSSTFPLDLLIFCPSASRIRPCTYTSRNGTLPVKCSDIITIRATQKKMMSKPVTSTEVGRKVLSSLVSCGQPSVENGHNAEENQVSSTSSSWRNFVWPACLRASSSLRATNILPCSSCHAGMRCPHHSWREMHQS